MNRNLWQRPGFSRVDLGVLLAIVALGLALTGQVVANTREKAQQAECMDNIQQIGQAVLKFEQVNGFIPPTASRPIGDRRGWLTHLLPYLGHEDLAKQLRMDRDWCDPANAEAIRTSVKVFQCPAAPRRTSTGETDGVAWKGATGDYLGPDSVNQRTIAALGLSPTLDRTGLFSSRENRHLAEVTDGLSNTLMVLESAGRPHYYRKGKRLEKDMGAEQGVWASQRMKFEAYGHSPDGTSQPGPCAVNCSNYHGLYSFHSGQAYVAFGDGSVRPFREGLNIYVFLALITARGGEVLTPEDF